MPRTEAIEQTRPHLGTGCGLFAFEGSAVVELGNRFLNGTVAQTPAKAFDNYQIRYGHRDRVTGKVDWNPPGGGQYLVPHSDSFINRYTSLASVYWDGDEAILDSRDNARFMLNDVGIRECLDSRQRSVALLNWHIEPENEKSAHQVEFCGMLENVVKRITNFYKYRLSCQEAIWYGKTGIQHRWGVDDVDGKSVYMPTPRHQDDMGWKPLNGDKLVFRQQRPDREMPPGGYEGQLGIRVGYTYLPNGDLRELQEGEVLNGRWKTESIVAPRDKVQPTNYGLAYFLSPSERRLMCVHKHNIRDAAYEDGLKAGLLYGEGIRSVIYWEWKQKQMTMAFLMEFVERMAGGITVWKYPTGNQQAEAAAKEAAENYNSGQEHIILMPVPPGPDGNQYGVELNEPGFSGVEVLQSMLTDYFGHRCKRYILGQILSSEAEATGMGSGVAELHTDTLLQIIKSDATNLEETLTSDLVGSIVKINVQKKVWSDPGFRPRFVLETEEADVDKKSEAWLSWLDRGLPIRRQDAYELIGAAAPGPGDEILVAQQQGSEPSPFGKSPKIGEESPDAAEHGQPAEPGDSPETAKESKPDPLHRYSREQFRRSTLRRGMLFRKPSRNGKKK